MTSSDPSPLACDRLALAPEKRRYHFEVLIPQIRALIRSTRELPDGFEFHFQAEPGIAALLEDFAQSERRCCAFFSIRVIPDLETNSIRLSLTGPVGAKPFIRSELAALFSPYS